METPILVPSPGVDRHIDAFPVGPSAPVGYLATSPEYHMKRLLAASSGPIFQITRAFRRGERGALHNPEFTLLEWYQPGWDHPRLMRQVEALLVALATDHGGGDHPFARAPYSREEFGTAFRSRTGVDPHLGTPQEMKAAAVAAGDHVPELSDGDRDGWLSYLHAVAVEPGLGRGRPTFVDLYPADQCALARLRPGNPPVAERFELYLEGVELANGFTELTDAVEQRERIHAENRARVVADLDPYPVDEAFLAALDHMPPAAGVAVGVDRVVMSLLGASAVDQVMAFAGAIDGGEPHA